MGNEALYVTVMASRNLYSWILWELGKRELGGLLAFCKILKWLICISENERAQTKGIEHYPVARMSRWKSMGTAEDGIFSNIEIVCLTCRHTRTVVKSEARYDGILPSPPNSS